MVPASHVGHVVEYLGVKDISNLSPHIGKKGGRVKKVVASVKIGRKKNDVLSFQSTDDCVKKFWASWEIANELERYDVIKPMSRNLLRVAKLSASNNDVKKQEIYDHAFSSLLKSYLDDYGEYMRKKYKGDE